MQVIDKYAQQNGYAVVLDVSNPNTPVLYASNTVDITKDIVDLYDKAAPSAPATRATSARERPSWVGRLMPRQAHWSATGKRDCWA